MNAPIEINQGEAVPRLDGPMFLTDGGMETSLVFHEGWDLPHFASFVLLESDKGREALRAYYKTYLTYANEQNVGFVLESPTWRANPDWGAKLGLKSCDLSRINHEAVRFMKELRAVYETSFCPMPISGNVGPRGDGYEPGDIMSAMDARDYHHWQVGELKNAGADFVSAFTMTNINEALGFALAAKDHGIAGVISFTLETDGTLPTGEKLKDAIGRIDRESDNAPAYYMINCAHPSHFDHVLEPHSSWVKRLGGIRANSSRCSHEELDQATELDIGNPQELGMQYGALLARFPHLKVIGGCCGTDHRHIKEIWQVCCKAA